MSAASAAWASRTPRPGARALVNGVTFTEQQARDWARLTELAAAAKHPAARAYLIDQRAKILRRARQNP